MAGLEVITNSITHRLGCAPYPHGYGLGCTVPCGQSEREPRISLRFTTPIPHPRKGHAMPSTYDQLFALRLTIGANSVYRMVKNRGMRSRMRKAWEAAVHTESELLRQMRIDAARVRLTITDPLPAIEYTADGDPITSTYA